MTTFTDYLQLNEHKLFKNLREGLPDNIKVTQNLLAVQDGVLYAWDVQNDCVLTLNVKEACGRQNLGVSHQILLPTYQGRFAVQLLRVNSSNTLLAIAGPNGVNVLELPERCPPYGAFGNNKEMIYCRSHNLDERLFTCNPSIEVRQVRFHPASQNNTHVLVLTSDNVLRLYNVENSSAVSVAVYAVGQRPTGVMPGTNTFFLGMFGETAVDFDFGPPELSKKALDTNPLDKTALKLSSETNESYAISDKKSSNKKNTTKEKWKDLSWPIYLVDGDGILMLITINLDDKEIPKVRGPVPILPSFETKCTNMTCSILCRPCTPPILCIATTTGLVYHGIVLPLSEDDEKIKNVRVPKNYAEPPDRALFVFESLELELGLTTTNVLTDCNCPIFLHGDESRLNHYFASHETGVHSVTIPALDTLQQVLNGPEDDNLMQLIVNQPSSSDYLLCTKISNSRNVNPVIGFALYYDPTSIIALLANGVVVSSLIVSFTSLPSTEDFMPEDVDNFSSPLKKMLSEPFDLHIQKILKQSASQPILKVSSGGEHTKQECYELLQRATQIFRDEHFKHHEKAREEIEKRIKVLQMLKRYQAGEIKRLTREKQHLQEKAENLAEKYEDIKDKQEDLKKRCEKLLILVSQKKSEPSEAEMKFLKDLREVQQKTKNYNGSISKLRNQIKYQEVQMENWKKEQNKKETGLGSIQSQAVRTNLQDMTNQITEMINEVTEYKKLLGLP